MFNILLRKPPASCRVSIMPHLHPVCRFPLQKSPALCRGYIIRWFHPADFILLRKPPALCWGSINLSHSVSPGFMSGVPFHPNPKAPGFIPGVNNFPGFTPAVNNSPTFIPAVASHSKNPRLYVGGL